MFSGFLEEEMHPGEISVEYDSALIEDGIRQYFP